MRKIIYVLITIFISSTLLCSCFNASGYNNGNLSSPVNNKIDIEGVWSAKEYSILDKNISTDDEIYKLLRSNVVLRKDSIKIGSDEFSQIGYRLKIVKPNYTISYEAKFKINDLPIESDDVNTYSIMYNNNVLGEFIYISNSESYFYYQGVLYTMEYKRQLTDEDNEIKGIEKDNKEYKPIISQGLYLGLKTERKEEDSERESYRTLWISSKSNEIMKVKEIKNIVIPRKQGIWTLEPKIYQDNTKKIYYEYFETNPLDYNEKDNNKTIDTSKIKEGTELKKNINYIGPEYIATEVMSNMEDKPADYYEVLPISNVNLENTITIQDLLGNEAKEIYETNYNRTYSQLDQSLKNKVQTDIGYDNFSIYRNNGKWSFKGKLSLINPNTDSYDFTFNIKQRSNFNAYDTLTIPWKILKGEIPLLVDAMISPDGSLAIFVLKNVIEIYRIEDGNVIKDSVKRVQLKDNEKVIMSEWCEGSYVEKWAMPFN